MQKVPMYPREIDIPVALRHAYEGSPDSFKSNFVCLALLDMGMSDTCAMNWGATARWGDYLYEYALSPALGAMLESRANGDEIPTGVYKAMITAITVINQEEA